MEPVLALGLMSGTSLDGIDAALIRTDGERVESFGPWATQPYDALMRTRLRGAMALAARLGSVARQDPQILSLSRDLTQMHRLVVEALLRDAGIESRQVAVVGFHGQTLLHRPENGFTLQIGDGGWLARSLDIDVVHDFRSADVALGGQGAPLVPLYHQGLARNLVADEPGPLAILNIGGIANVSWLDLRLDPLGNGIVAFDTGPGNGLIDDWCALKTGTPMDRDGALAAGGRVDAPALAALMASPQIQAPPPKSLDRQAFDLSLVAGLSTEDGAATLAAFTAASIAASVRHLPEAPVRWVVCGGGRHNPTLMEMLRGELGVPVQPAEDAGWRGDALEAEAFAYLAVRSLRGLPISLPSTTGAPRPALGGVLERRLQSA
ncbi:MAG: anhydro-N-acetylmuramic acid kinase [Alphaproteobacteria bacterium]|nr:anhydro-N-acetylmuramic acid kinase [Alphaproteobacteria bacterium]